RRAELDENMANITPFIWGMLAVVVIGAAGMLIIHPNRYRGNKSEDALLWYLEQSDPLFVQYVDNNAHLKYESFMAALFSLKRRGIVELEEVSSAAGKTTFRFTWMDEAADVDMADHYLYAWL